MLGPEAGLAGVPACSAAQGPLAAAVAQARAVQAVAALTVMGPQVRLVLQPVAQLPLAAASALLPAVAARLPGLQAAPARRDYILRNVPSGLRVGRPP